jgi:hypothetical protein
MKVGWKYSSSSFDVLQHGLGLQQTMAAAKSSIKQKQQQ